MQLRFELAHEQDDEGLRALLRRTSMPGPISPAFLREPSFFTAERAGNLESQVIVARDAANGTIVGVGCRGIRRMYCNGSETTAGYLSMLRGDPAARGGTGLARGYRFLRQLHADGKTRFYVTTILDENRDVQALLTSGRAGLPSYTPAGALRTFLIPLRHRRKRAASPGVATATPELLPDALRCLDAWNRRHQFAPVVSERDLAAMPHLYVHPRGTFAVWDQHSFKQTVVTSYALPLLLARPFYNAVAWLRRRPPLPPPGGAIRLVYGAFLSAAEDDPDVFSALVDHACAEWSGRGCDYLAAGLAREHPLAAVLASRAARFIDSTLYTVSWTDEENPTLDSRLPHVEIATL